MAINKIMCCCGSGLGSSMLVRMNVESILNNHGVKGVECIHTSISDASAGAADLFVVGSDLKEFVKDLPEKVIIDSIMDKKEIETKLAPYFGW